MQHFEQKLKISFTLFLKIQKIGQVLYIFIRHEIDYKKIWKIMFEIK